MCISETPANEVPIIFVPSAPVMRLDAARAVPFVHRIEPFAEAAERHRHLNDVGEVSLDSLYA